MLAGKFQRFVFFLFDELVLMTKNRKKVKKLIRQIYLKSFLFYRTTVDPKSSAQDLPKYGLCETVLEHSYYDFCHINLCTPCLGKHISDGNVKHKIVPSQERLSKMWNTSKQKL